MRENKKIKTTRLYYQGSKGFFLRVIGWYLIFTALYDFWQLFAGNLVPAELKNAQTSYIGFSIICLLLLAGGTFLVLRGYKVKNNSKRFMQYADLIENQNVTSVYEIADTLGKPVEFVMADIKKLAKTGSFQNAMIDEENYTVTMRPMEGELVDSCPIDEDGMQQEELDAPEEDDSDSYEVVCDNCGSKNILKPGQQKICQYCNEPLE